MKEESMPNRRDFIRSVAGTTVGVLATGRGFLDAAQPVQGRGQGQPRQSADAPVTHRDVRLGGKRVKVIDVHAHATIPEVADVVKGTPLARYAQGGRALGPERIQELDKRGIDIQVLDINTFWWYAADPDLAAQQLEHAVKNLGMVGAAIAGHVHGEPLSDPNYDPFWAKAQELDVMVF